MSTPRSCFLRSIRAVSEGMTEWVSDLERERKGWGLGDRPDLLFDSGDSDNDQDPEDQ